MPFRLENRIYLISRLILGVIFILAGFPKLMDPEGFARIIENYKILPALLVNPFALILPWVEMFCGIFLISGHLVKGSIVMVNLMMAMFIVALLLNIVRGVDITCGCFTTSMAASKHAFGDLIRDLLLISMGIWIMIYRVKQETSTAATRFSRIQKD
ncbi:MAG: MauE/DoxX family redox-associated membrane protein [Desulfobacterales bacterium]